jgi:protein-S-isoprenylcysteine O-methyltransferase Ste14
VGIRAEGARFAGPLLFYGPGMTRVRAALGSILFLVVAPGVVAGLIPYGLTGWDSSDPPLALVVAGVVLVGAGSVVLLHAFARFVLEGIGTPAPVAPTEHLVVGGAYRYVRNPMYLAVGSVILGQALLLGQTVLFGWLAVFALMVAAFVRLYEEPTLSERYGAEYARYCETVPRWLPRPGRGGRSGSCRTP